jgi:hypothetical protein
MIRTGLRTDARNGLHPGPIRARIPPDMKRYGAIGAPFGNGKEFFFFTGPGAVAS